ncbi:MAG: FAD:protein FMN transferase [Isosphaeraceae bacterium]|nr:FAD:protein FMN transferase [Isosphaeraceae bacterium]
MAHVMTPRKRAGLSARRIQSIVRSTIFALGMWAAVGAGAAEPRRFEFAETHMGSTFQLILYTDDAALASRASRAAFARIAQLDRSFSDYDAESELSKLCDRAGGPAVVVSEELFDILSRAKAMAERTGGALDPTIAPVGRLWRRARRERKLPDPELLAKARKLVGYERLLLDPATRSVRLRDPGMRLDLGAIGKGYAAQAALDVLRREGVPIALVGGAGDIVVGDAPPGSRGWRVDIAPLENPSTANPERTLRLANVAISTSGDAERYVEIDGVRYSHILDPRSGGLSLTQRMSTTVVARDGATADALDTAVCVLGVEPGIALVESTPGASCYLVRGVGAERRVAVSRGFPDDSSEASDPPARDALEKSPNRTQ